jgi:rhamnogalacturonan hydrolase
MSVTKQDLASRSEVSMSALRSRTSYVSNTPKYNLQITENVQHARNIAIIQGNNVGFIKTYPGGSGYVSNVTFENIRSKASLYGLDVTQYWQSTFTPDTGAVKLSNLTFKYTHTFGLHQLRDTDFLTCRNFTGSLADGAKRPPISFIGNDLFLIDSVTIEGFSLWTETGTQVINKINNAYGHGDAVYGANNGLGIADGHTPLPTFTHAVTVTASPTGWVAPTFPPWALPSTGYGSALSLSFP